MYTSKTVRATGKPRQHANALSFSTGVVPFGQHSLSAPAWVAPLKLISTSWQNPVSGLWSDASDWSTGTVPNKSSLVSIAASGHYTVTIAADTAARAITLNDAKAVLLDNADLVLGGKLAVTAGTFVMGATGTLTGGTLSAGASGKVDFSSGATLSGVTYDGTLTIGVQGQTVTIANGLTLKGNGGDGPGTLDITGEGTNLVLLGNQSLNNATIDLGYAYSTTMTVEDPSNGAAQTLTLGPSLDFMLKQGDGNISDGNGAGESTDIINQGIMTAAAGSGHTLFIGNDLGAPTFDVFDNTGTIAVSNGSTLDICAADILNTGKITVSSGVLVYGGDTTGTLTNQGQFDVTDGGTVDFSGTLTSATFDSIGLDHAEVVIGGEFPGSDNALFVNTGTLFLAQLAASGSSLTLSSGGVISGGTLDDPDSTIDYSGGTLSGVAVHGTITLFYNHMTLENGITFAASGSGGAATINATDSYLYVADDETLNNAELTLAGDVEYGSGIFLTSNANQPQTLVLGSSFQIVQSGSASFESFNFSAGDDIINQGSITVATGTLQIEGLASFMNAGDMMMSSGGTVTIENDFSNSGSIVLNASDAVLTLDADWSNTGQIIDNGGTINLGGTFTLAAAQSITNNGGQVFVTGQLDNTGTLTIGANLPFSTADFEGTIAGGVINDPAGGLGLYGGTLSGVTYQGTLSINGNETATIQNGVKFQGAGGAGAGALSVQGGLLYVGDSETFSNASIHLNDGQVILQDSSTSAAQTLLLASSVTLVASAGDGIDADDTLAASIVNEGAIIAATRGGQIDIDGSLGYFANAGTLSVSNADFVDFATAVACTIVNTGLMSSNGSGSVLNANQNGGNTTAFSNEGMIKASAGGTLDFAGTSLDNAGTISVTGVSSQMGLGALTNTGTIIVGGSLSTLAIDGNWVNDGTIIDRGATLDLGGTFTTAMLKTIIDVGGGTVNVTGFLDNAGSTLSVGQGSKFPHIGLFGAVSGGTINEAGNAFTISYGGDLAGVTFNGALTIGATAGLYDTGIQNGTLANAGMLTIDSGSLTTNGAVTSTGTLVIYDTGDLIANQGATLAAVTNNGTIDAASGTISINAQVLGFDGALQIGSAATLILANGADIDQQADFMATTGTLGLGNPSDFAGTISSFAGSNIIDLLQIQATSLEFNGSVLSVFEGGQLAASLHFDGNYNQGNFVLTGDGHGGSAIGYQS